MLNGYCTVSYGQFMRLQKKIGRQMLHQSAQHVVLILLTLCWNGKPQWISHNEFADEKGDTVAIHLMTQTWEERKTKKLCHSNNPERIWWLFENHGLYLINGKSNCRMMTWNNRQHNCQLSLWVGYYLYHHYPCCHSTLCTSLEGGNCYRCEAIDITYHRPPQLLIV